MNILIIVYIIMGNSSFINCIKLIILISPVKTLVGKTCVVNNYKLQGEGTCGVTTHVTCVTHHVTHIIVPGHGNTAYTRRSVLTRPRYVTHHTITGLVTWRSLTEVNQMWTNIK